VDLKALGNPVAQEILDRAERYGHKVAPFPPRSPNLVRISNQRNYCDINPSTLQVSGEFSEILKYIFDFRGCTPLTMSKASGTGPLVMKRLQAGEIVVNGDGECFIARKKGSRQMIDCDYGDSSERGCRVDALMGSLYDNKGLVTVTSDMVFTLQVKKELGHDGWPQYLHYLVPCQVLRFI
jgi:hypothetical protein